MSTRVRKDPSREQDRRELVEQFDEEQGPSWSSQNQPGSFGCHELLDRTMLAAEIVSEYLLTHPACVRNRDWYALADKAATALQELYQRVGAEHLSVPEEKAP